MHNPNLNSKKSSNCDVVAEKFDVKNILMAI